MRKVDRIQLLGHSEEIKKLLNRKMGITEKLDRTNSADHHTNVILNVDLIEEAL
jgi:hypothetical protein